MAHEDLQLVQKALAGDVAARADLCGRLRCIGRILTVLNRRLARPLQPEDLADVQSDTVVTVWSRLGDYEGRAALESWVYRFCSLTLMGSSRRLRRQPPSVTIEHAPEMAAEAAEVGGGHSEAFESMLRHVAQREAEVLRMRFLHDLTPQETAGALGVSLSSVKTHYYRALAKLGDIVPALGPGPRVSGGRA